MGKLINDIKAKRQLPNETRSRKKITSMAAKPSPVDTLRCALPLNIIAEDFWVIAKWEFDRSHSRFHLLHRLRPDHSPL